MQHWIWQADAWPNFSWQQELLQPLLARIEKKQALLLGKASVVLDQTQNLNTLLANIVASSAIESETLNVYSLRSSLAKHLGLDNYDSQAISARGEGLAQLTLETLNLLQKPLTLEQLCHWHRLVFPTDELSFFNKIRVGQLRGDEPMQVVSGRLDNPKIHFQAPPRAQLEQELQAFLTWFNQPPADLHPIIRAGITHFWFITLHPFDDGNGRITRALTDRALAQADSQSVRLYAMAVSILAERKTYYEILEHSQKWPEEHAGALDITNWLAWFLNCLEHSLDSALEQIERTLGKARFWQTHQNTDLSAEQKKVLNRLLDGGEKGFEQGISASQYQKVAKVSKATATRHLTDLLAKNCIEKLAGGGRSTRYQIAKTP